MVLSGHPGFDLLYSDFEALTTGGEVVPAWSPDGRWLAFVDGPADDRRGRLVDTATGERSVLVDVARVRDAVSEATGETPPGQGLPFDRVAFVGPRVIAARIGTHTVTVDLDTGAVAVSSSDGPAAADLRVMDLYDMPHRAPRTYRRTAPWLDTKPAVETASPDGRWWASTRDGNIVRRSTYDGREVRWTTDGTPEHEWCFDAPDPAEPGEPADLGEPVTNWSPDGTRLAAYRIDHRGVARAPQAHYLGETVTVAHPYFPRAGGVIERTTLHLLDAFDGPPVEIDLGDTTDTYPVFAGWLPDGSEVLIVRLSRDCRRADVLAADAATGVVRELFTEVGETFVRTHHDFYLGRRLGLWLTPDGRRILWLSERDGWKHLYAYDLDGRPLGRLTKGAWPVDQVQRISAGYVYFTARCDQARPYDLHICRCRVSLPEDRPDAEVAVERLTADAGVHRAAFAPFDPSDPSGASGAIFVDTVSAPARPPVSVLRGDDGTVLAELSRADQSRLDKVGWTPPEQFTVLAADGATELWGVLFFPADFDASRRYPLVEVVYGGPQSALNEHGWTGGLYTGQARALAQLGYVTVVLDGRGTPHRSKAFHDAVHRNWGGTLVDDHAAAIRELADRHEFIDGDRVGVIGHSWGGNAAFRLLTQRPDIYRAGVAHAPCCDPYASVLYECYLGLPHEAPECYAAAYAPALAPLLRRPLLLSCGTSDHPTWADTVKLVEALIRAGKEHEFVMLPGQPHLYDTTHDGYLWRKIAGFLAAHLDLT